MNSYGKFIYLTFENFYNVVKKEFKSFEKYFMTRDVMIFSNLKAKSVNSKCELCELSGHEFDQCSSVFYLPSPHQERGFGNLSD